MKVLQITSPNGGTLSYEYDSDSDLAGEKSESERIKICKSCDEFIQITTICKKCGCFMILKTKLTKSKCPEGKW